MTGLKYIKIFVISVIIFACNHASADGTPVVSIYSIDHTASESGSTGKVSVQLDRPAPSNNFRVFYQTSGNATPSTRNNGDYLALPGSVIFSEGQTSQSIAITPLPDNLQEDVEIVALTLLPSDAYIIGNPNRTTVSIVDEITSNIPNVSVTTNSPLVHESKTEPASFRFELSSAINRNLVIHYQTSGSASPGANGDYQPLSGVATLVAGNTSVTIAVIIHDDSIIENNETIVVALQPAEGYLVNNLLSRSTITLIDDDATLNNPELHTNNTGIPKRVKISSPQKAKLNASRAFSATIVDANNMPIAGVTTQWSLDAASIALGGAITASDTQSNSQGKTQTTLSTGTTPGKYRLTVSANLEGITLTETITVAVGLIQHVSDNSSEGVMATTLDKLCPQLIQSNPATAPAQALVTHCQTLLNAAINNETDNLSKALRQIAPEELLSQRLIATQVNSQVQQRLKTRLQSLRYNPRPLSLNHLSYNTSEESLSGNIFENLLSGGGAGSSDDVLTERWSYFISGNLGDGRQQKNSYESDFEFSSEGITSGADYRVNEKTYIGGAISYVQSDITFSDNSGEITNSGYSLSLYGNHSFNDSFYIDSIISLGQHSYKSQRLIEYAIGSDTFTATAKGSPDSNQIALAANLGFQKTFNSGISTDIHTGFEYLNTDIDSYMESGAGPFNLSINKQQTSALSYEIGSSINRAFSQTWGIIIPQLDIKWRYDNSDASSLTGYFVADSFSTPFHLESEQSDQHYFLSSVGITTLLANGLALFFQYQTILDKASYDEEQLSFGARFSTQW